MNAAQHEEAEEPLLSWIVQDLGILKYFVAV